MTAHPALLLARATALALALLLLACGKSAEKDSTTQAPVKRPVAPQQVIGIGRVEPEAKLTNLAFEVGGIIQKIHVSEGQMVRAGQVLVELNHDLEDAALAQAQAALAVQQNNIRAQEAALISARLKADNARQTADRLKQLVENRAEVPQRAQDAETEATTAKAEVQRQEAQLAADRATLTELQTKVQTARIQVNKRFLRAPTNGKLLSTSITAGSSVQPLQPLWEFAPESELSVLMEADELYAQQVQPGQTAFIRPLGLTDTLGRGTVVYVAPNLKRKSLFAETAGEAEDRRVREVRIRLEAGADARILLGARVEAIIHIAR